MQEVTSFLIYSVFVSSLRSWDDRPRHQDRTLVPTSVGEVSSFTESRQKGSRRVVHATHFITLLPLELSSLNTKMKQHAQIILGLA